MNRLLIILTLATVHSALIDNCLQYAPTTPNNPLQVINILNLTNPSKSVCISCIQSFKLESGKCVSCGTQCMTKTPIVLNTTKTDQTSTSNIVSNNTGLVNKILTNVVQSTVSNVALDFKPIQIAIGKSNTIKLDNLQTKLQKLLDQSKNSDYGKVYLALENGNLILKRDTCTQWNKVSQQCTECIDGFILNQLIKKCLKVSIPILLPVLPLLNNSSSNSTNLTTPPINPVVNSTAPSKNDSLVINKTNSETTSNTTSPPTTPPTNSQTTPPTPQYNITKKIDSRTGLTIITIGTTKFPPVLKVLPSCSVYRDITYECVTCESGSILFNGKCYAQGQKDIGVLYGVRVVVGG